MATYKIDSSLLTAQADEIRTLNGTTATMNPSQMTTALQSANAEVAAQEQKIIEITEMLQGKALGGSGVPDTCTVTMGEANIYGRPYYYVYTALDENGNISYQYATANASNSVTLEKVVCNSIISVSPANNTYTAAVTTNAIMLFATGNARFFAFQITATAGETATITFEVGSGGGND